MLLSELTGLTRGGRHGWGSYDTVQNRLRQMQEELQRLFSPAAERPAREYPAVNVWTNEEEILVTSELPGVNSEDLDISVAGRTLTLKGSRKADEAQEDECCHRRECRYGNFARAIDLPYEVDGAKVSAKFAKGILTITLPRTEADKPKKITISSN
ncbi:MAG: Hsp20/alpha crystallin family protein [Candidatus Magnetominusculus sp. LBB02]|nr:Hsp20/alpha crystallin family protein [Candidatus Magnetominusculus sp. LBB02]